MIVVIFNPSLEKKDFDLVIPKVQDMFPEWEWCSDRENILDGLKNNPYAKNVGSLMYKKWGNSENNCLKYSGGWLKEDTKYYEKYGDKVEVIDGWELIKHKPLDTEDVFSNLTETIKRVLKESEDDLEWAQDIVSKPIVYSHLKSKIGDRVVRGPDWAYGNQDHNKNGVETVGTVISEPVIYSDSSSENYWVDVRWENGNSNNYEIGPNDFGLQYAV